jgi:hypothetical protein
MEIPKYENGAYDLDDLVRFVTDVPDVVDGARHRHYCQLSGCSGNDCNCPYCKWGRKQRLIDQDHPQVENSKCERNVVSVIDEVIEKVCKFANFFV